MKDERVEVLGEVGSGVGRFDASTVQSGRRVDVANVRGAVEVTRSGTPTRTARGRADGMVGPPA